jgi:hypothetical protein
MDQECSTGDTPTNTNPDLLGWVIEILSAFFELRAASRRIWLPSAWQEAVSALPRNGITYQENILE